MEPQAIASTRPPAAGTSTTTLVEDMDLAGPSTSKAQGNMPTASQPEAFERTTSEDDWHTVLTLRQKKQQARAKKQGRRDPKKRRQKKLNQDHDEERGSSSRRFQRTTLRL
ncbi:hypothetical protein HPB52_012122 [Rhipicephalus sanguineus]|uniref:Uncharacterized protein n=1 Tax=Rhipicephalus sanguineus TaxID=34632 RepID=A0A9D4T5X1_RHISA|nr:hypothetical protein HPB52_012122 [Rhipicephalus sanguineus]